VIWLLRDYDEACKAGNIQPARLIFTFAPFGRKDTAHFLKWLGVEIPEGTEKRVLSRSSVKVTVCLVTLHFHEDFTYLFFLLGVRKGISGYLSRELL